MKNVSQGKEYDELPSTFKQWIVAMFNTIDTDGKSIELCKYLPINFLKVMVSLVLMNIDMTVSIDRLSQKYRIWIKLSRKSLRTEE